MFSFTVLYSYLTQEPDINVGFPSTVIDSVFMRRFESFWDSVLKALNDACKTNNKTSEEILYDKITVKLSGDYSIFSLPDPFLYTVHPFP